MLDYAAETRDLFIISAPTSGSVAAVDPAASSRRIKIATTTLTYRPIVALRHFKPFGGLTSGALGAVK